MDLRTDTLQRFPSLGALVLEAAALVDNHHVERPVVAVVVHQPLDVLAVDNIQIGRPRQCFLALDTAAQYGGHPHIPQVIPFLGLTAPRCLGYLLRRDDKHLADLESMVFQLFHSGQGGYCFP